jgi:diketogulonate reductase-like aldo/keto reductase
MIEDYVPISETWKAMEGLVAKGLTKNIGVANFGVSLLRDLINASTIKPAVLQMELHPLLTQKLLIKYCESQGIKMTGYSSFGGASYIELGGATED